MADDAARLMLATEPDVLAYMYGGREQALATLAALWRADGTLFGHARSWAALADGRLVGLAVAYDPPTFDRLVTRTDDVVRAVLGADAAATFFERLEHVLAPLADIPPTAVYLNFLSVTPAEHGRGRGSALLAAIVDEARAAGAEEVHLDVAVNTPARRFYERRGFATGPEVPERQIDGFAVPGYRRMVLSL